GRFHREGNDTPEGCHDQCDYHSLPSVAYSCYLLYTCIIPALSSCSFVAGGLPLPEQATMARLALLQRLCGSMMPALAFLLRKHPAQVAYFMLLPMRLMQSCRGTSALRRGNALLVCYPYVPPGKPDRFIAVPALTLVSIIFSYAYPKEGSRVYPEGFPAAIKIHSEYHVAQGKLGSHLLFPFDLGLHQFHKLPDLILRQGQSR